MTGSVCDVNGFCIAIMMANAKPWIKNEMKVIS